MRAVAIIGAWLLAMQAAGLPLLALPDDASCCCTRRDGDAKCHCRICTHAREVESNQPLLKTCGGSGPAAVVVSGMQPSYPASMQAPARPVRFAAPAGPPASPPPDPVAEVLTPPPLQRS